MPLCPGASTCTQKSAPSRACSRSQSTTVPSSLAAPLLTRCFCAPQQLLCALWHPGSLLCPVDIAAYLPATWGHHATRAHRATQGPQRQYGRRHVAPTWTLAHRGGHTTLTGGRRRVCLARAGVSAAVTLRSSSSAALAGTSPSSFHSISRAVTSATTLAHLALPVRQITGLGAGSRSAFLTRGPSMAAPDVFLSEQRGIKGSRDTLQPSRFICGSCSGGSRVQPC